MVFSDYHLLPLLHSLPRVSPSSGMFLIFHATNLVQAVKITPQQDHPDHHPPTTLIRHSVKTFVTKPNNHMDQTDI